MGMVVEAGLWKYLKGSKAAAKAQGGRIVQKEVWEENNKGTCMRST